MSVIIPAAIVFPPSLNANLIPLSKINGNLSSKFNSMLSPGMTHFLLSDESPGIEILTVWSEVLNYNCGC